jgi:PAS domain S-box-containing protein
MNVLIVDDRPTNLKLLRFVLSSDGHTVHEAHDGVEALALLKCERIDAIISDILMPRMDGYRLCDEVRRTEQLQDIPFIFYTATYTSAGDERLCFDLGADKYIRKPAPAEKLLAALREVTEHRRRQTPQLSSRLADAGVMKEYNERLVAKLEEKNEEVSATHEKLRRLLEHSPAVIYGLRMEGENIIPYLVSENVTRLLGFSVSETLSYEWWFGQLHPEDANQAVASIAETLTKGTSRSEYRLRHKNGGYRWVEDNRRLVHANAGNPAELSGVWTDVSERKRLEEDLRRSEERFRELAENIQEVFWMTDPAKNQMLYISPAYEKIWGRTCENLYAEPAAWLDAIHSEDRAHVVQAAMTKQASGTYDEQYRIVRPDGSIRWIHDRASPVRDATGEVCRIAGVAEDITERRLLEEQFRQVQKMEAIGTLAGGIAHDFNNILAVIGGHTELLKMSLSQDPESMDGLEAVALATRRATNLVRQILTFSRQQEIHRQAIVLCPVIEEAVKFLRATIPTTIEIQVSISPDTPVVLADATQIHQVLMNLGTNAWHAMKDRPGILEVKAESFDVDQDLADAKPRLHPGKYARVSIKDNGKGMSPATLDRIFEPFFTTKAVGEGTGLGLAVVHGIMQSHEGLVSVYSQPGQGTLFHLYFPAHASAAATAVANQAAVPTGAGQRILYVDDEMPLVRLGKKILERLGYLVEPHTSVTEALALVRADPRRFHLVVTDQTMPGMTGVEFARELTRIRPDLPIVLTTGYTGNLDLEHLREVGVHELLLKPPTIHTLGAAVHRVLTGKAHK